MAEAVLAVKNVYLKHRSLFLLIIKLLTAVCLIGFIIYSVNINRIVSVFTNADKQLLSAAFMLSFFNIYLQYIKWKLVCGSLMGEYEKGKIVKSLFYGFTAGAFTPARIGEYVGRAVPFTDKPLLKVSSAVFIDKLFSLLIVFLIGSIAFLFFIDLGILYTVLILMMVGVSAYFLVKGELVTPAMKKIINRRNWSRDLFSGIALLKQSSNEFRLKLLFTSLLFYICFIIQFALLTAAFSHQYDFMNYIRSANLVMFAKTIIPPVSFGELGIREGASVYFLKRVGVGAAAGFNAAIFLFIINVLMPALTGLIFFLKRKS